MDLKGAKIVSFYHISGDVQTESNEVNKVKIPHYQRPYSWDKGMVKKLIDDWHQQNETEYFAGSIVTVADTTKSTHELIDGQQRFTTIFLINYVLFLLLRVTTRQAITQSKILHIEKLFKRLQKANQYLFQNTNDSFFNSNLIEDIQSIEELEGQNKEDARNEFAIKYIKQVGLPDYYEGSPEFKTDYHKKLTSYVSDGQPLLTYDRKSFESQFSSALAKVVVTMSDQNQPRLSFVDSDLTSIEKQYTDAIEQIFNSFSELNEKIKPFDIALSIIDKISIFLTELKVCVVQTGNPKDAYTLFEVLNDRSMALADLDLIKNQFYKQYCLKCEETDSLIDSNIELFEAQWGDKIYNENADYKKKFITFFSATYLSGSSSIGYNQNDIYREKIKRYLDNKPLYQTDDIKIDFNIFQACSLLVNLFDLRDRDREKLALQAEYNKDNSPVYKVVLLLSALKYNGVLAGYFNLLLKYIEKNICKEFTPSKVEGFIKKLIKSESESSFEDLNKQAIKISQLALLHKDFKGAKELANKLIANNNRNSLNVYYADDTPLNDENKELFNSWLDGWQYSSSDLKVRILFAKLLPTTLKAGKLEIKSVRLGLAENDVAKLHLDHMEPSKIESSNATAYFINDSRDFYINSLGNMFPLPGQQNIEKSNKPFITAFAFLKTSGLDTHWITEETQAIFDRNNSNNVPKLEFFTERKNLLKDKFYEVLKLESK
jgi:energy-coupling factor transporter ATP-binding protein EcfA2